METGDDCIHCGRYCITKFLKEQFLWKRDKGKVHLVGGCYDIWKKDTEQYRRGMRNGCLKIWCKMTEELMRGHLNKGVLSVCTVEYIRSLYPSPNNIYHGHPFSEEELRILEPMKWDDSDQKPAAKEDTIG